MIETAFSSNIKTILRSGMKRIPHCVLTLCFVLVTVCYAAAQSTDANAPTPLREPSIAGRIAPLDVGDARLTRHYYVFTGLPGDLEIAVTSENLNGDVDVFTFDGLRPLSKLTLFAGGEPLAIEKTIFLRQPELLLVRVEARSVGDTEGTYRLTFGGAFALAPEAMLAAAQSAEETANAESSTTPSGGRRVNSVGGRITPEESATAEPVTDVAATLPEIETRDAPSTPAVNLPRSNRGGRRNAPIVTARTTRRPPRPPRVVRRRNLPPVAPPTESASNTETTESKETTSSENTVSVNPTTSNETADATPPPNQAETPSQPAAPSQDAELSAIAPQFRLVVETLDGKRLERAMSGVRRVTITNGELVILTSAGRTERVSMKIVTRIAVEP
ncbi:MAG: hypothetical protein MSG64_17685 [Pyrinomonadaceae bacterium MAG19_C2-C3]|nr:hypothetical protein [Pyrinomonadaceae bacterium MAG19_C2-C3]